MKLKHAYVLITELVLLGFFAASANAQAGSIKGKVKEKDGKMLEAVLVRATFSKRQDDRHEIKTDSKGEFEFIGLPAGEYSLSFEKQGYKTYVTRKLEVVGGETLRLSRVVEMDREADPYASIRGAVLYGVGYSLSNASVIIERIDGVKKFKQEKSSGEGGEFGFRLKAEKAKYRITASARGFQPASTEIEIESDEVRNVALTLQQIRQ